ncbi:MAG: DUF1778 domain-containing protein [Propionibacteriaceae bacterium]|jgi:uncharacterized protein (DUF1778 family)|nr:DUF1778 domain-containing protein [Propionibacteriaceae bacterium]
MGTKTARLDLRLTDEQRHTIERASELAGTSITGWSVSTLMAKAHHDIAENQRTIVADEHWDAFVATLDEPVDPRLNDLLGRTPVWA